MTPDPLTEVVRLLAQVGIPDIVKYILLFVVVLLALKKYFLKDFVLFLKETIQAWIVNEQTRLTLQTQTVALLHEIQETIKDMAETAVAMRIQYETTLKDTQDTIKQNHAQLDQIASSLATCQTLHARPSRKKTINGQPTS